MKSGPCPLSVGLGGSCPHKVIVSTLFAVTVVFVLIIFCDSQICRSYPSKNGGKMSQRNGEVHLVRLGIHMVSGRVPQLGQQAP